jgi:hypothetical protein
VTSQQKPDRQAKRESKWIRRICGWASLLLAIIITFTTWDSISAEVNFARESAFVRLLGIPVISTLGRVTIVFGLCYLLGSIIAHQIEGRPLKKVRGAEADDAVEAVEEAAEGGETIDRRLRKVENSVKSLARIVERLLR